MHAMSAHHECLSPLPAEDPFSTAGIAVGSHLMSSGRLRCLCVWDENTITVVLAGCFLCCAAWSTACVPVGLATFSSETLWSSFGFRWGTLEIQINISMIFSC